MHAPSPEFPRIAPVGLTGLIVQFADHLSEPANRAAIAFRAALEREGWAGDAFAERDRLPERFGRGVTVACDVVITHRCSART